MATRDARPIDLTAQRREQNVATDVDDENDDGCDKPIFLFRLFNRDIPGLLFLILVFSTVESKNACSVQKFQITGFESVLEATTLPTELQQLPILSFCLQLTCAQFREISPPT